MLTNRRGIGHSPTRGFQEKASSGYEKLNKFAKLVFQFTAKFLNSGSDFGQYVSSLDTPAVWPDNTAIRLNMTTGVRRCPTSFARLSI